MMKKFYTHSCKKQAVPQAPQTAILYLYARASRVIPLTEACTGDIYVVERPQSGRSTTVFHLFVKYLLLKCTFIDI